MIDAKTGMGWDGFDEEAGYFHGLKVSWHRLLISCKRKNSNYAKKKSGNTFDQVIKMSITNEGQVHIVCLQL